MPRGRTLTALIIAAVVIVYVGVVALYALNERAATIVGCSDDQPADAVLLALSPTSVDAAADRISATVSVVSFGPAAAAATGMPESDLTLVVSGTDGARTFSFPADDIPPVLSLRLITDGAIEQWPFDAHVAQFAAVVFEERGGDLRPLPTVLCGVVHVPSWSFSAVVVEGTGSIVLNGDAADEVRLTAQRSVATVAFGLIILMLMIVMPVLGLIVAIRVLRGERKAEATLMSWMAAMLFATIPLRTFLPGSPPVGSWVDYLVVLWVIAALIAALVIYVVAWLKWAPPGERPPR
jgi:hypothetical protein